MNFNDTQTKQLVETEIQLFYIKDSSFAKENEVYGGHGGRGIHFRLLMSSNASQVMAPTTFENCQKLITMITMDAQITNYFNWEIIPLTKISLNNFKTEKEETNFELIKQAQILKFGV